MSERTWVKRILGDPTVATISSGGTPSRARPDYFGGSVKWVKSGDLNDATITNTEENISELGLRESAAKVQPVDTVLIAMYGATVGKTALLKTEAATNQAVCSIRPNPSVFNPRFLQYLLTHIRPQLLRERYGGAQPNISQTIIRNLNLPCPARDEQERIAALLHLVQRAIRIEEMLVATTRELKQSAMGHLFMRGLLGERQKETEIGLVPESWEVIPIGAKAKLIAGGTPSRTVEEYWAGGIVPWVKTGEVDYRIITATEEKITPAGLKHSAAKILPKGTLLIAMYGQGITRGKVAMLGIDAATNQACAGIILKTNDVSSSFLYYDLTFAYERMRGLSHGAQQQNLNAELISGFPFPIPKYEREQGDIVEILQAIDLKISVHERKRATLQELFKTLLHQLMTGQIRVDNLVIDVSEVG
jgi:type I restriction enzyme S subunit